MNFHRSGRVVLSKNKKWEIELIKDPNPTSYFSFHASWTFGVDHWGPFLSMSIYSLLFSVQVYDTRHIN